MSAPMSLRVTLLSVLIASAVVACGESKSVAPDGGADPLQGRVQLQSPDTAVRGGGTTSATGDGFFRGAVRGYSEADFPDTLKSAKALANVAVTAYPAELTNREPKLGPARATVTTNANGEFTFGTLPGGLYVVTFTPPAGASYDSAWTLATASAESGGQPWIIMLRAK